MTLSVLNQRLRDRFWRLNNLYFIADKEGKVIRFKMTPEQYAYYDGLHYRNIF